MSLNLGRQGLYRLYNKRKTPIIDILSPYQKLRGFELKVNQAKDGSYYYTLPLTASFNALILLRHLGVPAYHSADLYTFILSLFLIPAFYYSVIIRQDLRSALWDILWYPDDLEIINRRLYEKVQSETNPYFSNALGLMVDLKLRCDAWDRFFSSLSRIS